MNTDTYKLRRRVRFLWMVITLLAIAICCLMVRLDSVYDSKIIGVRGENGYNTVTVQKVKIDTVEYFDIPDAMLPKLVKNIDLVAKADTSLN